MLERDLQTTAELAYLALAPEELQRLEKEVDTMVSYFATMQELDVSALDTSLQVSGCTPVRQDIARAPLPTAVTGNNPLNNPANQLSNNNSENNNSNNNLANPGTVNCADAILEQAPDLEDRFVCIPNVL